ncbi:MAG: hypothetical protein KY476_12530 [Planctomycetes bacterium]|nr:hypothetical protein [Planctomycetota bacterium]
MPLTGLILADASTIISLIVGLVMLLGWILNYATAKNMPQAGPRRPAPPPRRPQPPQARRTAEEKLQNEIDIFLQDVRGGRRQLAGEAKPVVPPPEPPRPAVAETRRAPLHSTLEGRQTPTSATARRKRAKPRMGEGVRERVAQHIDPDRLGEHARQLGRQLTDSVSQHLGRAEEAIATAAPAVEVPGPVPVQAALKPSEIRELLRSPGGVRQAILMNEILSRPRALRRG